MLFRSVVDFESASGRRFILHGYCYQDQEREEGGVAYLFADDDEEVEYDEDYSKGVCSTMVDVTLPEPRLVAVWVYDPSVSGIAQYTLEDSSVEWEEFAEIHSELVEKA